jgi:predicted ATPase/DNA-binding SARP family transcriptional activator/Tfp pilus assembly protein PilF
MARLTLSLFGPAQIALDGLPVQFKTKLAQALLVYLATESGHAQSRESLAALLWPEQPEASARHNLRQTLLYLRQAIRDGTVGPFLHITRQTIQFDATADYRLDVAEFGAHLEVVRRHPHEDLGACAACMARLAEAAALYQGDFLAQFFLDDNGPFEEWALAAREALRARVLEALYLLADHHTERAGYDAALQYARRQVELDGLREDGYRQWMRAAALSGRRSEALGAHDALRRVLDEELSVAPAAETTALYGQIVEGRLKPAGKSPATGPRHNLPRPLTPFVGREAELADISARLDDAHCALLTLIGPGGVGKTALAVEAARRRLSAYRDGVAFVALAPLEAGDHLATAIGSTLTLKFTGKAEPQAELLAHLRDQQLLLVLDNFEPLLAGEAATGLLIDILLGAPGVQMLVTSREVLNLRAEWLYEVAGLPYPPDQGPGVDPAGGRLPERYAAVRLFTQQAHRLHRDFAAGPAEPAIGRVCRLVAGLPLAIELAAALTRTHSCAEIAAAVEHNLDSLTTTQRDVPPRQRSLRALFEYSWSLLGDRARAVLARLGVFRGGLTAEATGFVAGAVEADLSLLANKSFLRRQPDGRYELHEVLRQYAAEKLVGDEAAAATAHWRHADYYTRWVQRHEADLSGETLAASAGAIQPEIDNVRAAWRWAVDHGDLPALARSMAGLARYFVLKGLTREGEAALRAAIQAVRERLAAGEHSRVDVALFDGPESDQPIEVVLAALLVWHGRLLARLSRPEAAAAALTEGIRLAPADVGQRVQAQGYLIWATLDVAQSDYEAARAKAELTLSLAQATGWQKMEADACRVLGNIGGLQGELLRSRQYYARCLELEQVVGQQRGNSATLSNLGSLCLAQGDTSAAGAYFERALAIHRALGDQASLAQTLVNMGQLCEVRGDLQEAQRCHTEALQITRAIGDQQHEPDAVLHLGLVALGAGQPAAAQTQLETALELYRALGDRWGEASALEGLGRLAYEQDAPARAAEHIAASLALRRAIADHLGIASSLVGLGQAAAAQGRHAEACRCLLEALETAGACQATPLVLRALAGVATLLAGIGRWERAAELLACIVHHPRAESQTRERARRAWAEVARQLAEPAAAAAQSRGRQLDLETLATALPAELSKLVLE